MGSYTEAQAIILDFRIIAEIATLAHMPILAILSTRSISRFSSLSGRPEQRRARSNEYRDDKLLYAIQEKCYYSPCNAAFL